MKNAKFEQFGRMQRQYHRHHSAMLSGDDDDTYRSDAMKLLTTRLSTKRPVNLTLSEKTVEEASQLTGNLSITVDMLLARFISREPAACNEKRQLYAEVADAWNQFEAAHGSFVDEYATL
ncbi:MAG: type II toxin-antitoxin system CcdA family antitoxin [Azonexus sp.]|jgi:hypothetical protein|nr:type II toxin-antitoxin system CcdA family antitoxin [Azonexus sp.]